METYKDEIASNLIRYQNGTANPNLIEKIQPIYNAVFWAWENWDKDVIATFYESEKPESPTEEFIYQWVENEDFEADGYNIEELKEIFS